MRLLDPRFKYVPAARTDVAATWRKFGFKPTTDADRKSRMLRPEPSSVVPTVEAAAAASRRRRPPDLNLASSK
jgi:hypothetical protein